ncbi:MAG: prolipoprotein diacylglyceryl transferase [Phycisphaerae bacterium]|nr:prolipoprotein diacylglyceryl transferase [Phycisphaerae bacterium]
MILAYYIQTLSPFIWQWGHSGFGIRWYGTAYLTGFILAYFILKKLIKDQQLHLPAAKLPDFVLFVAIFGVVIGGRLGEAALYRPGMFTTFTHNFPYWSLLMVQDGGMSAHGGIIGVFVAAFIFARRHKCSFLNLIDAGAMVAPIGIGFGRLANFINGELYGHVWHSRLAVQFPTELIYQSQPLDARIRHLAGKLTTTHPHLAQWMDQNPVAGMVTFLTRHLQAHHPNLMQALAIHPQAELVRLAKTGKYPFLQQQLRQVPDFLRQIQLNVNVRHLWQSLHPNFHGALPFSARLQIIRLARQGNAMVITQLRHILEPRIPSELIEAFFEGLVLFLICWFIGRNWRKAGMASGAFAVFYPIMRIIGEQFRQGDQPKYIFGHWISLGVLYSVPMLIVGLAYWIYLIRRPAPDPAASTFP